jgi:Domain of unknown function (DUF3427)
VHASYNLDEILAAYEASTVVAPRKLREGVYWHRPSITDLFFVTLDKAERDYSPTTRYLDYAISDRLFHWESQSVTTATSPTGLRYLNGTGPKMLFIRKNRIDEYGRTAAYFCAGPVTYVEHRSERPIQITWRLEHALPGATFADFRAAIA